MIKKIKELESNFQKKL